MLGSCPWTLSTSQSSQFCLSYALGKLFASWTSSKHLLQISARLSQDTIKITWKCLDLKMHALHCANKLLVHVRLSFKVHLTPNTIFAKMQTWSCSKSNLTFFCNIWIFFEQQYYLKFDMLWFMTELVRGMGLFLIWRQKLFCMHVHKELMPCKLVCDVKSRIEPGPC